MTSTIHISSNEALTDLYWQYKSQLFNFILDRTSTYQDAQDRMQDVWVRVIRFAKDFDRAKEGSLRAWLYAVTRSVLKDAYKYSQRQKRKGQTIEYQPTGTEDPPFRDEKAHNFIEKYSTKELRLYGEGFSYKEIAQITDQPVGTVSDRIYFSRRKLNRKISSTG